MYSIKITEKVESKLDLPDLLRCIANLIESGNNLGYGPNWQIDFVDEPILTAITSLSREGRTIIIYKDEGVKIFDQGPIWNDTARVINIEPQDLHNNRFLSPTEMDEINQILNAP